MARELDGGNPSLAVDETGEGAPVAVFLHGVFMDRGLWNAVVDRVPGRRVRIDMPGHGDSPAMPRGAHLDDHVTAVAASLDDAGVGNAVIVGHSWGGMVAVRLAAIRPDLIGGLVLANTPLLRTRGVARLGFWMQRLMLRLGFGLGAYGRIAAKSLIGAAHRTAHPEDVEALANRMRRLGRRQIDAVLRSVLLEPEDSLHLLAGLTVPWIFVAGRDDYVIAGGMAGQIASLGDLWSVDGAHTTPLEDPGAVAEAVDHIRSQLRPPAGDPATAAGAGAA